MVTQAWKRGNKTAANDGSDVPKNRANIEHWFSFLSHMTSFLPVVAIVGMGTMLDVDGPALLTFTFFAGATIAFGISLSVVQTAGSRIRVIKNDLRMALRNDDLQRESALAFDDALRRASFEMAKYKVYTGVTALLWSAIAAVQLQYLANQPITEGYAFTASFCGGIVVVLAIRQLWVLTRSRENAIEDDALREAIREGQQTELTTREEVFNTLKGKL